MTGKKYVKYEDLDETKKIQEGDSSPLEDLAEELNTVDAEQTI